MFKKFNTWNNETGGSRYRRSYSRYRISCIGGGGGGSKNFSGMFRTKIIS
jgi:hypothetical protein